MGRLSTLDDWLNYQENLHSHEIDLGLERIQAVYQKLFPNEVSSDQCHACRYPITKADKYHQHYEKGVSCPHCYGTRSKDQSTATKKGSTKLNWQKPVARSILATMRRK